MKIYTREFNSLLGQIQLVENEMEVVFRSAVDTMSSLPEAENAEGDVRMVLDSDHLFAFVGGEWVDQGVFDVNDLVQERLMQGLS